MSTYTWKGPNNGNWSESTNWSPQPSAQYVGATNSDVVVFPNTAASAMTINLDISPIVSSITFNNSSTSNGTEYTLQSNNGSTLTVLNKIIYQNANSSITCPLQSSNSTLTIQNIWFSGVSFPSNLSIVMENNFETNITILSGMVYVTPADSNTLLILSGVININNGALSFTHDTNITGQLLTSNGPIIECSSGLLTLTNTVEVASNDLLVFSGNILWQEGDGSTFQGRFQYQSGLQQVGKCIINPAINANWVLVMSPANIQFLSPFKNGAILVQIEDGTSVVQLSGIIGSLTLLNNSTLSLPDINIGTLIIEGNFTADATATIVVPTCPQSTTNLNAFPIFILGKSNIPSSGIPLVANAPCGISLTSYASTYLGWMSN